MSELNEKCAVVGVSTIEPGTDAALIANQALFALQHRGVEGSGIVTNGDGSSLSEIRRPGMVRDVFSSEDVIQLVGDIAIGHNRYSTSGDRQAHLQPFIHDPLNYAMAHNGNIADLSRVTHYLNKRNYTTNQFNDSELFGLLQASLLHRGKSIAETVQKSADRAVGSFSSTAIMNDKLVAFRDRFGIRPLEIGSFQGGVVIASETCALDTVGASHTRSVEPGELVIIKDGRIEYAEQFAEPDPKLDIFEIVYFARHDSYLYGKRVSEVRREFGKRLAKHHLRELGDLSKALVVPVPDTSVYAAEGFASEAGIESEHAIIKNRFVGRSFMETTQQSRQDTLRKKHTMISERIEDRDVIVIDDSIVRLNTMPNLVKLARNLGARSVSVLIASPPVRYPDFYGVDTPRQAELAAANMNIEQMRVKMEANYLGFLTVSDMVASTGVSREKFNLAAFTGDYPIPIGDKAKDIIDPVSTEYMD